MDSFKLLLLAGLFLFDISGSNAQQVPKNITRLGVESDYEVFPQATPKELMASVAKAIKRERFDYLAAHLMDPAFVDARLDQTKGKLEDLGKEIQKKYKDQPEVVKDLLKVLTDGEQNDSGTSVVVRHKDVKNLQVYLKKAGEHWVIENRMKDEKEKE